LPELEADLTIIPGLVLLCIDNAALVYAGEENDRTEVTQFMAALNGLASRLGIGIVLSTHKSKSTDGSPLRAASGSTAWINAARHVLDLQPESSGQGPCLTVIKSNCTKPGEKIPLVWINGVLTLLPSLDAFENRLSESRLIEKIRELVSDGDRRGVPYSSAPRQAIGIYQTSSPARASSAAKPATRCWP
jgi:RecA-family ATPase